MIPLGLDYPATTPVPHRGLPRLHTAGLPGVTCEWSFDDGTTLNACDSSVTHSYAKPGCYDVSLTLVHQQGAEMVISEARKPCFVVVTNGAPVVTIASPAPHRLVRAGDPILLEIEAADTDRRPAARRIARVELFRVEQRQTNWLATLTSEPYRWEFTPTVEPGLYTFIARATDDHGAATWSQTVPVEVIDLSGEVLIVRNRPPPAGNAEIELLQQYLGITDIPIPTEERFPQRRPAGVRVLKQAGLHFDLVRGFRLII